MKACRTNGGQLKYGGGRRGSVRGRPRWGPRPRGTALSIRALAVLTALLVVGSGMVVGIVETFSVRASVPVETSPVAASAPVDPFPSAVGPAVSGSAVGEVGTVSPSLRPAFTVGGQWCSLTAGVLTLGVLTLACQDFQQQFDQLYTATEVAAMRDLIIATENGLNITGSQASLYNATIQELVSYFADRAEAVVPYFLNQTWTNVLSDEIATYSGLSLSLDGILTALGIQEYQVWNATVSSFQNVFGFGQIYGSGGNAYNVLTATPGVSSPTGVALLVGGESSNLNTATGTWGTTPTGTYYSYYTVSAPWEFLTGFTDPVTHIGSPTIYLSLEPGGTVVDANLNNVGLSGVANWTLTDLTTGQTVPVPQISNTTWRNQTGSSPTGNIPILTKEYPFSPFDLFKLQCLSGCSNTADYNSMAETLGAYVFENSTTGPLADRYVQNDMVPHIAVGQEGFTGIDNARFSTFDILPNDYQGVCGLFTSLLLSGSCSTPVAASEGFATEVSGGPGQVVGGNNTLTQLGGTFVNVLNNVMTLAHAYYSVLRAATNDSQYAIPSTCSVPVPSDAFPTATNPAEYQLSLSNTEVVYLSYLESVAQWAGQTPTNHLGFCSDPNLTLTFNWTSTWSLNTNITASVYFGTKSGPVYANGSLDAVSKLASPSTWPIRNVDPTLLYPYEYQMDVPVGAVYPIPFNDPTAAVELNWTGNPSYGALSGVTPNWGVPSYASLNGEGNAIFVSGALSGTGSRGNNSTGDAIYISSCVVGHVAQTVCPLQVTYFNNFTFGVVHAFVGVSCAVAGTCGGIGGGGGFSLGGTACGTGGFNSWYDAWAGYVVSGVSSAFVYVGNIGSSIPFIGSSWSAFWTGLGCLVGWLVLILVVIVLIWVVYRAIIAVRSGSGGGGSWLPRRRAAPTSAPTNTTNVTVNLDED